MMNSRIADNYERPTSEQMVDLHVYLMPPTLWRQNLKSAVNEVIQEMVSAGFVRVLPEMKVVELRHEIENQLGYDLVPQEYVFLKSVGRCLTQVKGKQELSLKVKSFLPPQAYCPEIFLLEATPEVRELLGHDTPQTDKSGSSYSRSSSNINRRNYKNANRNGYHREEIQYNEKKRDVGPDSFSRRHISPTRATQTDFHDYDNDDTPYNDLHLSQSGDHGSNGGHDSPVTSQGHDSPPDSQLERHRIDDNVDSPREGNKSFLPPLSATPTVNLTTIGHAPTSPATKRKGQKGNLQPANQYGSAHTNQTEGDSGISDTTPEDFHRDGTRDSLDRRKIVRKQEDRWKDPGEPIKRNDEDSHNGWDDTNDVEQEDNIPLVSKIISPPPLKLERDDSLESIDRRETESARVRRKQEKDSLLVELERAREDRKEAERRREELVKKAKQLQSKTNNRRNQARDIWKKRYFDEKKKTPPLEEQCNRLRHEIELLHRRLLTQLENNGKQDAARKGKGGLPAPSQKNNYKIQATKLQHDNDDLRRRVENSKMKLTAEMKLRNQAETELRALRAELTQKKINITLSRSQQLSVLGSSHEFFSPRTPGLTPR